MEFQIFAVGDNGSLQHAGVVKARRFGRATAQRDQKRWDEDTDLLAQTRPDCPRITERRPVVEYRVHPVGKPHLLKSIIL